MMASSGTNRAAPSADGAAYAAATPPPSPSVAASPYWAPGGGTDPSKSREGFSPFVAFCFTINYILGTGFLTLPWAFVQGGLVLSTLLLLVVCVLADVAKDFILETIARAEAMLDERMRWIDGRKTSLGGTLTPLVYSPILPGFHSASTDDVNLKEEASPLVVSSAGTGEVDYKSLECDGNVMMQAARRGTSSLPNSMPGTPRSSRQPTPGEARRAAAAAGKYREGRRLMALKPAKFLVKNRKFEINALCRVFLGRRGKDVYISFLSMYLYCALWAYAAVFSSAMARQFPLPVGGVDVESGSYVVYAAAFAFVVVPMSCLELHEQVTAQVLLSICRFNMVFLMVWTSSDCAGSSDRRNNNDGVPDPSEEDETPIISGGAPLFRPSGMHKMLPIVVFAMIYHNSIPGLAHPVGDKKKLRPIFISTTVFCALAYSLIGIVLGYAFGDSIEQSSNLNWAHCAWEAGPDDGRGSNLVSQLIKLYIVLFPALDVLSAYPLNAITLGDNMLGAYHGRRIHEVENNRWERLPFRLLASVPPIVLAVLVRELGTITDYAGTAGFLLAFAFPALLYIRSRGAAKKRGFSQDTYYSSYASNYILACVLVVFGVGMSIFCGILYVIENNGDE